MNKTRRVAFCCYNIGWADGPRTVMRNNLIGLHRLGIRKFHLIGGKGYVSSDGFRGFMTSHPDVEVSFTEITHLFDQTMENIGEKAAVIATEMNTATLDDDLVVIEDPNHGLWIPALVGFNSFADDPNCRNRVLFRIHDFAVDRPYVMSRLNRVFSSEERDRLLYPNKFKLGFITPEYEKRYRHYQHAIQSWVVPNSVPMQPNIWPDACEIKTSLGMSQDDRYIIYPVRAMPRKMIEEAIFLTAVINRLLPMERKIKLVAPMARGTFLAEYPSAVRALVTELGLQEEVVFSDAFDIDRHVNADGRLLRPGVHDAIAASEAVLVTSRLESFGYAYLEPFMTGKGTPVLGRRIDVVGVFEDLGIDYGGLFYDQLTLQGKDLASVEPFAAKVDLIKRILAGNCWELFCSENNDILSRYLDFFRGRITDNTLVRRVKDNQSLIEKHFNPITAARILLDIAATP